MPVPARPPKRAQSPGKSAGPNSRNSGIDFNDNSSYGVTQTVALSRSGMGMMQTRQEKKKAPPPSSAVKPAPPPPKRKALKVTNDSVWCPGCDSSFEIVPDYFGMEAECPECGLEFIIPHPEPEEQPIPPTPKPAPAPAPPKVATPAPKPAPPAPPPKAATPAPKPAPAPAPAPAPPKAATPAPKQAPPSASPQAATSAPKQAPPSARKTGKKKGTQEIPSRPPKKRSKSSKKFSSQTKKKQSSTATKQQVPPQTVVSSENLPEFFKAKLDDDEELQTCIVCKSSPVRVILALLPIIALTALGIVLQIDEISAGFADYALPILAGSGVVMGALLLTIGLLGNTPHCIILTDKKIYFQTKGKYLSRDLD
ncbi:MAG: hypothetical protein U9O87_07450 [Verrucomicrobiota bacterium]|nr:hypothetical protein [Verrucomicrobiota bacterium]